MERKIGYSDPFTIKVPHSGTMALDHGNGLIEIPQDQLWEVTIRFLYVEDEVNYLDSDYWNYNEKDNTVYVKINNNFRLRYLECMKKKIDGLELTREEERDIEDFEVITQNVSRKAAEKAMEQFEDRMKIYVAALSEIKADAKEEKQTEPKEKKSYRTAKRAGDVVEVPNKLPLITNPTFQNAMTYNDDDKAYLQPFTSVDGLVFENGMLFFEGLPATSARLEHLYTKDNIEEFNLPMLRVFYAIILNQFWKTWQEDKSVDDVLTFYIPDLAKNLGKSLNTSQKDIDSIINTILSFQNIMGIVDKGKRGNDILPVLVYLGNDTDANTIKFSSPYMIRVIQDLYKASIRKSKTNLPLLNKDGTPKLLPSHTYIPKLDLGKERNQKAVEIVCIIVTTIEQAGSHGTAHISAKTIVERNQLLKQSIDNTPRISNKNTYLERSFTKAWELLRTKTDLLEKYKNIQLPDPKDKDFKVKYIPTMSTLDMVFEFPHEGKIKD